MTLKLLLWASLPGILVLLYIVKRDLFPEPKGAIISATVLGFLIYMGEKKYENKGKFNYLKFIFGSAKCKGITKNKSVFNSIKHIFD